MTNQISENQARRESNPNKIDIEEIGDKLELVKQDQEGIAILCARPLRLLVRRSLVNQGDCLRITVSNVTVIGARWNLAGRKMRTMSWTNSISLQHNSL
ncbi:unnamed protein product [Arabis nemorensis]|uniref:Uncharacterized protein n=1 Tax=Arabis nemorensis TaxID=586526 RepID=A0A565BDE9_9BRAS|nr:unnamed protein product [Arabis nemorensis]